MTCLRTKAVSAPCARCGKRPEECHVVDDGRGGLFCKACCVVCGAKSPGPQLAPGQSPEEFCRRVVRANEEKCDVG